MVVKKTNKVATNYMSLSIFFYIKKCIFQNQRNAVTLVLSSESFQRTLAVYCSVFCRWGV